MSVGEISEQGACSIGGTKRDDEGSEQWRFDGSGSARMRSSPTVVTDPASGDSVGTRVDLRTLGHHDQ